ncbi:hypothetical protein FOA52_003708 [Chlamydomonas sp. UWO 241]|nr:hypothetical protein FOA52_003708 [Chlamydomonas sp. UWO 241]
MLEEVYTGCACVFDDALDSLSALLACEEPAGELEGSSAEAQEPQECSQAGGESDAWDSLPEEMKEIILGMLSARDVAKAAATCRDFARRVKRAKLNAKVLTIPLGLSLTGIIGFVAGHPNAHSASLSRWARAGLQDRDFAALLAAVSSGSRSRRRNTPVESISFKGWSGLKDGHVMTLCATLQHLKEVDLSDCTDITDAALMELSKYLRRPPTPDDSSDDESGHEEHLPAAAAAPAVSGGPAAARAGEARSSDGDGGGDDGGGGGDDGGGGGDDGGGATGAEDGDEDLLFDMESGGPQTPAAAAAGDALPGGAGRSGGAAGAWGGGRDEVQRVVSLAALAALAASPAAAWGSGGGGGGAIGGRASASACASPAGGGSPPCTESPPSSLMSPGAALGSHMAALRLGHSSHLFDGRGGGAPGAAGRPPAHGGSGSGGGARGGTPTTAAAPGGSSAVACAGPSPPAAVGSAGAAAAGWPSSWSGGGGGGGGGGGRAAGWVGSWERGSALPASAASTSTSTTAAGAGGGGEQSSEPGGASPPSRSGSLLGVRSRMMAAAGRGLRSLIFAGCSQVTSDGVRALLNSPGCKASLESLDVSRCPKMTRQALLVPPASCLRVLKCAGCNNLMEVTIQLPATCPLTELHLNNCKQLSKLLLVAPNLKLLHIGGCKAAVDVQLRCPQMTHLLGNLCFSWADVQPEQWLCPRLQHLNLFGARHMESASLAVVLAQSPALQSLNLNGCNTLSTVVVPPEMDQLSSIDVSGCKGLVALRCASPVLVHVKAKACPRLQLVDLSSPQLATLDVSLCSQLDSLQLAALAPPPPPPLPGQAPPPAPGSVTAAVAAAHLPAAPLLPPGVALPRLLCAGSDALLPADTLAQRMRALQDARRALAAGEAWARAGYEFDRCARSRRRALGGAAGARSAGEARM